jgi:hypothetical protein
MPVAGGPKITTTGILLEVDAANASSYASGSSTWVNVFRPGTRNGTINGTIGFNQDDSKGVLTFPGTTSSYVDFGNIGDLSSVWSFQVAVKPAPSASGNYTILSYASGSNTGSITYKLDYSSSNQSAVLSVYSATGSTQVVYRVTGSVPTGSWSIVNASYGNSVIGMYVNGAPTDYVLTTGSTAGYNANNRLYLGGTFGITSSFYTGSMASFFSYNTDVPNTQLVQNYNAYATRFGLPPSILAPVATDPDALRFISIAEITNATQVTAINNLVIGLKANSLWDKMQAIYPFVGGTAFSHKFNLKNPLPLNTAFQATFAGDLTHTSFGIGSGSFTGYADSNFLDTRDFTDISSSLHVSVYGTTTNNVTGRNLPFHNDKTAAFGSRGIHFQPNADISNVVQAYGGNMSLPAGTTLGFSVVTRTTSLLSAFYHRKPSQTVNLSDSSTFARSQVEYNIRFLSSYYGSIGQTIGLGFASIGTGLSQTDAENLYTVVQAYQTALGRQVS